MYHFSSQILYFFGKSINGQSAYAVIESLQ